MLKVFFLVIITIDLIVGWIIFSFTGCAVYPSWLIELLLSAYWFIAVFGSLNRTFLDTTQERTFLWNLKPMIAHVFIYHLIAAYALSFFILPWIGVSHVWRILIAYPISYALIVAIPMKIVVLYYPKWQVKREEECMSAEDIHQIALQCEPVQQFTKRFPNCAVFVTSHIRKNYHAICHFLIRHPRREQEGLTEDITLSIPVDMRKKQPIPERIESMHYLFKIQGEKSAVFHFQEESSAILNPISGTLDADILNKFDTRMYRFPSLKEIPFPIAIHHISYERI